MKKVLFIIISNFVYAQNIPEPIGVEVKFSSPLQTENAEKLDSEITNSLQPFIDTSKYGIGFINYSPTGDEFSTGATFKIYNPSKKTIKYIWFTFAGLNTVGDLVPSKGKIYQTLKGIGPVTSDGIGEWDFQYVWFTNIVESLRMITIKIQYMDSTFKTLKYNEGMYIGTKAYERSMVAIYNKSNYEKQVDKMMNERIVSINDNTIYDDPDQNAEFPGGNNAFHNIFSNKFDSSLLEGFGSFSTIVSFVVEKDGSISDINAVGVNDKFNLQAINTVKSIQNKWYPAKIGNTSVRSRYKIPLKMNFK